MRGFDRPVPVASAAARGVALGWALGLVLVAWAGSAAAQEAEGASARVPMNVMVVHTSEGEGGIDPRARELDARLGKRLRYKSMRVIREERIQLGLDDVGTIRLPDGRAVRVRPLHKGKDGVLMAVDVEGTIKLDARARNHHKVVIGAGEYLDGSLAVSIEPDYVED